ncbi:MAG: YkgJ family cysteine cluster protein [Proteobacteria bacterium]|nr:YkgJ family cysteine cluster protein [Pseudomonadota bacterium]
MIYYRSSQSVTFETSTNGTQIVKHQGNPANLTPVKVHIIDFLCRFPDSSVDEIQTGLVMMTGQPVRTVQTDLDELEHLGMVEKEVTTPRINMPYPIDHTCEMCGCSCLAQLVGPLTDAEHQNILNAHSTLGEQGDVPKDVNPIMKGLKPDGTCLYFLNFPGKRCFFLGDDNLCKIHGKLGAMQKPAACRRFPVIAIQTESEIRLGIKPYCYANMRVCHLEPAKPEDLSRIRTDDSTADWVRDLLENAAFRPVIRIPDEDEALQARIQESQILSWLQSDMPYAGLLASLAHGGMPSKQTHLPKPFVQDVQHAFKALAIPLRSEAEKLGTTVHARHCRDLCSLLEKPITHFDGLEPDSRFGKYLRFSLFEAVFLRETSRFPAVSLGTFALALGGLAAVQDMEHASDHLTAWMRLFAQTQAFAMLFPTPQAMAAIMRNL